MQFAHNGSNKGSIPFGLIMKSRILNMNQNHNLFYIKSIGSKHK